MKLNFFYFILVAAHYEKGIKKKLFMKIQIKIKVYAV